MEVRKTMPEEVKNQIMPNGKKRVVTEKLPDKLLKKFQDGIKKKQKLSQDFFQLSVDIVNAEKAQRELVDRLKANNDSLKDIVTRAGQKLRLQKRKEYNWRFDRRDSFIGVYNPPKPKQNIIKPSLPPKNPIRPSDR